MSEHQERVLDAVQRLFALYERGNDSERAAAYARALIRLPIDRLERAIEYAETMWDQKSPPSIPWLLRAGWKDKPPAVDDPTMRAEDEAERQRTKSLRYYLERFSMPDWYEFRRVFGFDITRSLYAKFELPVPDGVVFSPPDPAWCHEQREGARVACREAFYRLGAKRGVNIRGAQEMAEADRERRERESSQEVPF